MTTSIYTYPDDDCVLVWLDQTSDDPVIIFSSGPPGPIGPGVAPGGTTGQVLTKASNTNYDTEWQNTAASNALIYALIFG